MTPTQPRKIEQQQADSSFFREVISRMNQDSIIGYAEFRLVDLDSTELRRLSNLLCCSNGRCAAAEGVRAGVKGLLRQAWLRNCVLYRITGYRMTGPLLLDVVSQDAA